jgi:hypothetical protein
VRKIISLYRRDYDGTKLVYDEVVSGAEWVLAGEGVATRKWDGTCCMVRDGQLFKRYTLRRGKTAPDRYEPATEWDENTGKQEGWIPVDPNDPADKWHIAALDGVSLADGTYELVGPKVQGGIEGLDGHALIPHGRDVLSDAPRSFDSLRSYLDGVGIEGIVWHHPDGRMVKIKARDFGVSR